MNQAHDPNRPEDDPELERAAELLDRSVHFLERCVEDPQAAIESEDPRDLIQGLRALAAEPKQEDPAKQTPTIHIHRRRSA